LHTRFMVECPLFIGIVSSRKPPQRSRHSTSRPPAGQPRTTSWCMENEVGQVWLRTLSEKRFRQQPAFRPQAASRRREIGDKTRSGPECPVNHRRSDFNGEHVHGIEKLTRWLQFLWLTTVTAA